MGAAHAACNVSCRTEIKKDEQETNGMEATRESQPVDTPPVSRTPVLESGLYPACPDVVRREGTGSGTVVVRPTEVISDNTMTTLPP